MLILVFSCTTKSGGRKLILVVYDKEEGES